LLHEISRWPDARVVTPACPEYPARLLAASTFPCALFVRGRLDSRLKSLGVVGSRRATTSRLRLTREWCRTLSQSGFSIVSGLAVGIDSAAHQGALDASGHTVAVLGTGLANTYPAQHIRLVDRILASGGAVVSQFAPHTPTHPGLFPARNATLAGLADTLVVMQAAAESGALITAQYAKKYGRTVWALPSHPHDSTNSGCVRLLKEGARLISTPADLTGAPQKGRSTRAGRPLPPLSAGERRVLDAVDFEGVGLDELTQRLGDPPGAVLELLLGLELAGVVARQPGSRYART
jgi:DNA processing protein